MFRFVDELHRWRGRGRRLRAAWPDGPIVIHCNLDSREIARSVVDAWVSASSVRGGRETPVGEKGPELIRLPPDTTITPLDNRDPQ